MATPINFALDENRIDQLVQAQAAASSIVVLPDSIEDMDVSEIVRLLESQGLLIFAESTAAGQTDLPIVKDVSSATFSYSASSSYLQQILHDASEDFFAARQYDFSAVSSSHVAHSTASHLFANNKAMASFAITDLQPSEPLAAIPVVEQRVEVLSVDPYGDIVGRSKLVGNGAVEFVDNGLSVVTEGVGELVDGAIEVPVVVVDALLDSLINLGAVELADKALIEEENQVLQLFELLAQEESFNLDALLPSEGDVMPLVDSLNDSGVWETVTSVDELAILIGEHSLTVTNDTLQALL